jgi:hypothetical protein
MRTVQRETPKGIAALRNDQIIISHGRAGWPTAREDTLQ